MRINSTTLAKQIAASLDASDKGGTDKQIEASVWNNFVQNKGGKRISNFIHVNKAFKSIIAYLCRQAKQKGQLIVELGQEWIDSIKANNTNKSSTQIITDTGHVSEIKHQTNPKTKRPSETTMSSAKKVDTTYSKLSRDKALKKAKNDKRLECLQGGSGWSIDEASFITDIPYARKYTGEVLSFVSNLIGEHLVVTSALGTKGTANNRTPHKVSKSYCTHHNAENPKLDIKTNGHAKKLQQKLLKTRLFSRVSIEPDHLDIQIKHQVYVAFASGHQWKKILAMAKSNKFDKIS